MRVGNRWTSQVRKYSGRNGTTAGKGTLAADTPTLTLRQSAPDTELLAVGEGIFETIFANDAATADFFGFTGGRTALGEEQIGVNAEAVCLVLPGTIFDILSFVAHEGLLSATVPLSPSPALSPVRYERGRQSRRSNHCHRCSYNDVIFPYHKPQAQGGIVKLWLSDYSLRCSPPLRFGSHRSLTFHNRSSAVALLPGGRSGSKKGYAPRFWPIARRRLCSMKSTNT
jgi:hypothetical protein